MVAEQEFKDLEERVKDSEDELIKVKIEINQLVGNLDEQKKELLDSLNLEFANVKIALNEIVVGARTEFEKHKAAIQALYEETAKNQGGKGSQNGYLLQKNMVPDQLTKDNWRDWKEDAESYMDTVTKGMKEVLHEAAKEKRRTGRAVEATDDHTVWREANGTKCQHIQGIKEVDNWYCKASGKCCERRKWIPGLEKAAHGI